MYPNQRPPAWWQIRARHAYYQQRFNLLPCKKKILYGCGPLVVVLALCSICAAVSNASQSSNQPTVAQASPTSAATSTPHPKLWATAVAATETAQARVTPTPKPAPTTTPIPTPQPTATPVPIVAPTSQPDSTLSVKFTSEDATDHASSSISVQTSPLAALTITVTYCTGKPATSDSLRGTVYADSSGTYTWTWVPDTTCYGEAVAKVKASLNGQTASDTVSFGVM